jgi:hypothetical protein
VIITADGNKYSSATLLSVAPDGLVIEYVPDSGGTGIAKLKFERLPESIQKQFGYDPVKASAFEKDQAKAAAALSQQLRQGEKTRAVVQAEMTRAAAAAVVVRCASPVIDYSYYDTAHPRPPSDLPGSARSDDFAAATYRQFGCQPDFSVRSIQKRAGGQFHVEFETVTIFLNLSVSITLPDNPSPLLRAHEEGHRSINEHFYACGEQAARRIGDLLGARGVDVRAKDSEAAKRIALSTAQKTVREEYRKCITDPAGLANQHYDQLTNHGRNNIDSGQAAQEAISRFEPQLPN